MNEFTVTFVAYVLAVITIWLGTRDDAKVKDQWRRPLGPLVRLATVFVTLHALCLLSGIPVWKGCVFLLVFLFVSLVSIGPFAFVSVISLWVFYQWVFWFPAREEVVLSTTSAPRDTSIQESYVGQTGEAVSDLVPMGRVSIDGQVVEARSSLGSISKGEVIEVESFSGFELVVRKKPEANQSPQTTATSGRF